MKQMTSVMDPDSLKPDPDPSFKVNPDPATDLNKDSDTDPGFWWPKLKKKIQLKFLKIFS